MYEKKSIKLILKFLIFWMTQKILSIFWKILSLKIYKCFDPLCRGRIQFEITNFLDQSEHSEVFLKILILEKLLSVLTHFVWELFFYFLDESEDSKKLFYLGINLEKLFYTRDKFGKKLKIFFPNLSLGINLEKSWKYFFRIYP